MSRNETENSGHGWFGVSCAANFQNRRGFLRLSRCGENVLGGRELCELCELCTRFAGVDLDEADGEMFHAGVPRRDSADFANFAQVREGGFGRGRMAKCSTGMFHGEIPQTLRTLRGFARADLGEAGWRNVPLGCSTRVLHAPATALSRHAFYGGFCRLCACWLRVVGGGLFGARIIDGVMYHIMAYLSKFLQGLHPQRKWVQRWDGSRLGTGAFVSAAIRGWLS